MALEESKVLERYFDEIAPNYQLMNKLLSLNLDSQWRNQLKIRTNLKDGDIVLDIACGTCDILSTLMAHTQKNDTDVVYFGLDLSFGMLQAAQQKKIPFNLIRSDGVKLPIRSNSVDLITISFGYRNMPSHSEFLKESFRVLKPGGQLLILELTQPENQILKWGNQVYLKTVLPFVSGLFGRDKRAYDYLARSIQAFPNQKSVCEDLKNHGFASSNYVLMHGGITTLFESLKPSGETLK